MDVRVAAGERLRVGVTTAGDVREGLKEGTSEEVPLPVGNPDTDDDALLVDDADAVVDGLGVPVTDEDGLPVFDGVAVVVVDFEGDLLLERVKDALSLTDPDVLAVTDDECEDDADEEPDPVLDGLPDDDAVTVKLPVTADVPEGLDVEEDVTNELGVPVTDDVGVPVVAGVPVGLPVGSGVPVGDPVCAGVPVELGVPVNDEDGVTVTADVTDELGVPVTDDVGVPVNAGVADADTDATALKLTELVAETVGLDVTAVPVADGDDDGVGENDAHSSPTANDAPHTSGSCSVKRYVQSKLTTPLELDVSSVTELTCTPPSGEHSNVMCACRCTLCKQFLRSP